MPSHLIVNIQVIKLINAILCLICTSIRHLTTIQNKNKLLNFTKNIVNLLEKI